MSKRSARTGAKKENKKIESTNSCCVYDFTSFDVETIDVRKLRGTLKVLTKKYTFQIEKGNETDKLHYQGRFSLKEKKRMETVIKKLRGFGWSKFNLSITSKANRDNDFYVCKEDTRLDGPFTDENDVFVPLHVEEMTTLLKWQQSLKDYLDLYDKRSIHVVYDPKGNIGKSSFVAYMCILHKARKIPLVNDYKDLMRMAYDVGQSNIYLVDMPRAMNKEKLFQFYSAVEELKSGYCFDDRYNFKERWSNRPNIAIFTNSQPDLTLMSKDMWKIWEVDENMSLIKYQNPETLNDKITEKAIDKLANAENQDSFSDEEASLEISAEIRKKRNIKKSISKNKLEKRKNKNRK